MASFANLGVKRIERRFTGTKITNVEQELVGKEIKILDFEICKSVKKADGVYIKLQMLVDGKKRFWATGGKFIVTIMKQVDPEALKKEPIETKVLKDRGVYYFDGTVVTDDEVCDESENVEIV